MVIVVYTIWFVFFQDEIQYILENAISTISGEKDIATGVVGILFIPFLIVCGILGIMGIILYLIQRKTGVKKKV